MSAHHHLLQHGGAWGVRLRARAGWACADLDRRLAEGADPDADPLLHARAERLVTPASRARLAAGLERVVATADEPTTALRSAIPVRRRPVRGARHELMRLAGELRHMPEPRPRGVAMAEQLLTEPSSPLYTASSSDEVASAARHAANAMRAHEPQAHLDAPNAQRATPPRGAAERHFCVPTVTPLPARVPVDSGEW
jgi:hypothetical protein